jgi:hypothetical protein
MAHAVFHTGTPRHPKVAVLSDGAFRLWFAGVCYCADHLTDGLIPKAMVRELKRNVTTRQIAELVATVPGYRRPLWVESGECFQVNDYLNWNESREEVQAGRERNRQRVRRHRNGGRNGRSNGVTNPVTTEGNTEHRTLNTDQGVTRTPADAIWELWRTLNAECRVDEFVAMTPNANEQVKVGDIARKNRTLPWVRLVMQQFLTTEHEPIASKQRSIGYLVSWWAFIEGRLRETGRRPEAA